MISKSKFVTLFLVFQIAFNTYSFAAPINGTVVQGDVNISSDNTVINQNSDKAIINWDSFNINSGETVTFNQNSSSSVVLNRITDGNPTNIMGNINANGKVFLVNQSGIVFGTGSSINVGGLLATTANINDADFMSGNFSFTGAAADITNSGNINITDGGYAVLMGRKVNNGGVIAARLGAVHLASGTDFRLTFSGSDLIGVNIDAGNIDAETINNGIINADGSVVALTSKGVTNILINSVNNTGVIVANAISNVGGVVRLVADGGSVASSVAITGAKTEISATTGNINVSDITAADFNAQAQGDIIASVASASNINVASLGGGNIDITNANTGNVFINNLKSTGNVKYTQTGGAALDFNTPNVSAGGTLELLNANGDINSDFDFFNLGNAQFTANRVNLTKNNANNVSIDPTLLTRLSTTNLTINAAGNIDFTSAFSKGDLNLTLSSSGGSVISSQLLSLASLNVAALGDISLTTSLSRFSANSKTGNISLTNTGNLTANSILAKNGSINLNVNAGNLSVYSLDSLNVSNIKTDAGASVAIQGNGNLLKLNLQNGSGTSLEVANNGNIDLSWANGDFAKLSLRSLGSINVAGTNIFNSAGDIFLQAASLNSGNPLGVNAGGNAVIKLDYSPDPIFLKANTADISGTDMDIVSENSITFADLDNDGFAIKGNDISITTSGSMVLKNTAQSNILSIFSESFDFLVMDAIVKAGDFTLKSLGDITGTGRITADNVNISGNTIGVNNNSSIFINAGKGVLTATSTLGGQTINVSTTSWLSGVKNLQFVTSGEVYLNGKKTDTKYYALLQELHGRDLFPIQMTNISEFTEYKLLRLMEEKKDIISYDLNGRGKAVSIIKTNGKYSIR